MSVDPPTRDNHLCLFHNDVKPARQKLAGYVHTRWSNRVRQAPCSSSMAAENLQHFTIRGCEERALIENPALVELRRITCRFMLSMTATKHYVTAYPW